MAHILVYASNIISRSMAGPGIRSREFAKALSAYHQVTLIVPELSDIAEESFQVISRADADRKNIWTGGEVLIAQTLSCSLALKAKRNGIKIIIDAYDPAPLELLEQFKFAPPPERNKRQASSINHLIFGFRMADAIVCASEKQRDLWIGFLTGQKLIVPERYDADSSLRNYIDVVPFGLSSDRPSKTGPGLREKYGFAAGDKIVLWGGGIWNWFDPLSLIEAMRRLSEKRPDIKLVFMGMKTPEPGVPEMEMGRKAIELAQKYSLIDRTVFFNPGWVPYEERQNFLLDADIGTSIHFDHLETRYSFRTRMLDYIWAELPILGTEGDSFAELIEHRGLGAVVPYLDDASIAESIETLTADSDDRKHIKDRLRALQPEFYWESVIRPIERMIESIPFRNKKPFSATDFKYIASFVLNQVKEKGLLDCFRIAMKKIKKR